MKLAIWQNYYLPEQFKDLDPGFIHNYSPGIPDKYMENKYLLDVYYNKKEIWKNADYVGLLSQRFYEKTGLTFKEIEEFISKEKELKQVYLLTPFFLMKNKITTSNIGLMPIQKLSQRFDTFNRFPFKIYNYNVEDCLNFCNYWICTPEVFEDYMSNYLIPTIEFLDNTKDREIRKLLKTEIAHRHKEVGINYYPHPFFLESLFPIYTHYNKISHKYIFPEIKIEPKRKPRNIQWKKRLSLEKYFK